MTIALDPKFAKVVALWRSTSHAGEKANAQARAEEIAATAGMSLDQALVTVDRPTTTPPVNIFDGFEDFVEKQEPGFKVRRAAERAEQERRRLERRAAVIARFWTEEAALAPCERELRMHEALAKWRERCRSPYERWTSEVRGWSAIWPNRLPAEMLSAIEQNYPLPTTLTEAFAEHAYWIARQQDLEDVRGPGRYGDSGLDTTAEIRLRLIEPLIEHVLPATTLVNLRDRLKYCRDLDVIDKADILEALVRDADRLVASRPSNASSETPCVYPSTTGRDGQIRAALDADPSRSDRDIARSCRCSPTTVGKTRRAMGLQAQARSVHRGGQTFDMHFEMREARHEP